MTNIINLEKFKSIGTHWIGFYVNGDNVTYFILIEFELNIFQKNLKNIIVNKNIITNIYKTQAHNSAQCGYYLIDFIDSMLKCESY